MSSDKFSLSGTVDLIPLTYERSHQIGILSPEFQHQRAKPFNCLLLFYNTCFYDLTSACKSFLRKFI